MPSAGQVLRSWGCFDSTRTSSLCRHELKTSIPFKIHKFLLWKAICDSSSGVIRWTPAGRFFECARDSRHTLRESRPLPMLMASDEFRSVPYARGRRWRAAPLLWDAGAVRRGIEVESDVDEASVVVRWRLQRVRALVVPSRGPAKNPAWFRCGGFAQDSAFRDSRKRKVWGRKARPETRSISLLVRRGGREAAGVVADKSNLGLSDHPRLRR